VSPEPPLPLVIAASAVWDTPAPVNSHQIARRFAARGHPVLYVESTGLRSPSLRAPQDWRRVAARLQRLGGGLRDVAPRLRVLGPLALPGARSAWVRGLSERLLRDQVARALRRIGGEAPLLWAFLPTAWPLSDLPLRGVVYHCVDDYAGNPGVDAGWLRQCETRMLERADLVVASSPVLAERLREQRPDLRLAPNVADVALFGRAAREPLPEPAALRGWPHPRVLYVGNLAAYRIDPELLAGALEAVPDGCLVLVGATGLGDPGSLPPALRALLRDDRVLVAGARAHKELPAWMRHADVALIPFLDNPHTRGSLPLKLWEYLAAGLPVVARALPNLRGLEAEGVRTASDRAGFAAAVRAAVDEPPALRRARSAAAARHGWERRMDQLEAWAVEVAKP